MTYFYLFHSPPPRFTHLPSPSLPDRNGQSKPGNINTFAPSFNCRHEGMLITESNGKKSSNNPFLRFKYIYLQAYDSFVYRKPETISCFLEYLRHNFLFFVAAKSLFLCLFSTLSLFPPPLSRSAQIPF